MVICGLKLTHDGAIAVIDNNRLAFSVEIEKLNNNPRYSSIEDTSLITEVLADNGYSVDMIDKFVIDGWGGNNQDALAIQPRLQIGEGDFNKLSVNHQGEEILLDIAQYHERTLNHSVLQEWEADGLFIENKNNKYSSYLHVAGHIMSAYATSPFAKKTESSYVLVWDGGMYPRLYFYDAQVKKIENLGPIFLLIGNIYTIFSQHFGPFKVNGNFAKDSLSVAGKVMAYIALGTPKRELFSIFDRIYNDFYDTPMGFANVFANEFKNAIKDQNYSDEDILASFHLYLEELFVSKLVKKVARYKRSHSNICIAGGCALNIKWNSAVRESGAFDAVYVPPFPNDSGSAIGMACAYLFSKNQDIAIDWSVYSGPLVKKSKVMPDWMQRDCSVEELAQLLHDSNEPVVFLNGRAELGPRALGNRSILAAATKPFMKDILNEVKNREKYRPVSPICLEEDAQQIFEPGCPDPFMLFDHYTKQNWIEKIPAICHLDNTARLQTVREDTNPVIANLLTHYKRISGIPLLCNTSANLNGSGFFPDVKSVTEWGKVNYVWSENTLYEKKNKIKFSTNQNN